MVRRMPFCPDKEGHEPCGQSLTELANHFTFQAKSAGPENVRDSRLMKPLILRVMMVSSGFSLFSSSAITALHALPPEPHLRRSIRCHGAVAVIARNSHPVRKNDAGTTRM